MHIKDGKWDQQEGEMAYTFAGDGEGDVLAGARNHRAQVAYDDRVATAGGSDAGIGRVQGHANR